MDPKNLNTRALEPLPTNLARIRTAHGVLISLAIILWFPLGVFLLRLLKTTHTVRWHAIWQSIGLGMLATGFGLGRYVSDDAGRSQDSHVTFGTIIVVLFLLIPIIGWLHHRHYVATESKDFKRHLHVWGGRVLMLLGLVNGFMGLRLSKNKSAAYIGYGVIAGVFVVVYAGIMYLKNRMVEVGAEEEEMRLRAISQRK